ncbi:hypothetical protein HED50_12735 [Ochrobactrum oryzae]|nr:hypothetical protein [Brucella oryzae]
MTAEFSDKQCSGTRVAGTLGRKSWRFAGLNHSADHAVFMSMLIIRAKFNDLDPGHGLRTFFVRSADTRITKLEQSLPWNLALLIFDVQTV